MEIVQAQPFTSWKPEHQSTECQSETKTDKFLICITAEHCWPPSL